MMFLGHFWAMYLRYAAIFLDLSRARRLRNAERAMGTRMRKYLIMTSLLIPRLPERQAIHVQLPNWCDTRCSWRIGEDPGTESKVPGTSWYSEDEAEDRDSVYGKRSWDTFLQFEGPEKFSHPTAIANSHTFVLITTFYSHILNMNRGTLHTRSFGREMIPGIQKIGTPRCFLLKFTNYKLVVNLGYCF